MVAKHGRGEWDLAGGVAERGPGGCPLAAAKASLSSEMRSSRWLSRCRKLSSARADTLQAWLVDTRGHEADAMCQHIWYALAACLWISADAYHVMSLSIGSSTLSWALQTLVECPGQHPTVSSCQNLSSEAVPFHEVLDQSGAGIPMPCLLRGQHTCAINHIYHGFMS